jgi:hypothetical protein
MYSIYYLGLVDKVVKKINPLSFLKQFFYQTVTMDSLYRAEAEVIHENQNKDRMSQESLALGIHNLEEIITRLTKENGSLHIQLKELIEENFKITQAYETYRSKALDVVKLPIGKVTTFLALCQPKEETDDTFFYVKVQDGNMTRIVRSPSELEPK